ncbi:Phytochrome E, partial [Dissostichus eleginoides]
RIPNSTLLFPRRPDLEDASCHLPAAAATHQLFKNQTPAFCTSHRPPETPCFHRASRGLSIVSMGPGSVWRHVGVWLIGLTVQCLTDSHSPNCSLVSPAVTGISQTTERARASEEGSLKQAEWGGAERNTIKTQGKRLLDQ